MMAGYAQSKPFTWQPENTFDNSSYAAANLIWSLYPYLTVGVEYAYGALENKDGFSRDNHRIGFGMQYY